MKVFRVAVDSSCLIGLAQIGIFGLLREVFAEIYIPGALTTNLGKGESEVIILCKELGFDYALIDERTAREKAALMSVNTMGVLGVMDLAIEMGFDIDKKRLVKQLREIGFRISDKLYKRMFPDN